MRIAKSASAFRALGATLAVIASHALAAGGVIYINGIDSNGAFGIDSKGVLGIDSNGVAGID